MARDENAFDQAFRKHLHAEQRRQVLLALRTKLDLGTTLGEIVEAAKQLGWLDALGDLKLADLAEGLLNESEAASGSNGTTLAKNGGRAALSAGLSAGNSSSDDEDDEFTADVESSDDSDEDEDELGNERAAQAIVQVPPARRRGRPPKQKVAPEPVKVRGKPGRKPAASTATQLSLPIPGAKPSAKADKKRGKKAAPAVRAKVSHKTSSKKAAKKASKKAAKSGKKPGRPPKKSGRRY